MATRASLTSLGLIVIGAATAACGNLGSGSATEPLAHVTGSLATSGGNALPANTHVAIVWRKGTETKFVVTNDVAVVNGAFSFDFVDPPADELFVTPDENGDVPVSSEVDVGGATKTADPGTPLAIHVASGTKPMDTTIGGNVGTSIAAAYAGFVAYVDANGNGKLDLSDGDATSSDTFVASSSDLTLIYIRGGSPVSFAKLADKAGKQPTNGYNLFLNSPATYLPLSAVELDVSSFPSLPSPICYGVGYDNAVLGDGTSSIDGTEPGVGSATGGSNGSSGSTADAPQPAPLPGDAGAIPTQVDYPPSSDPNLRCAPDGTWFTDAACITTPPVTIISLCGSSSSTSGCNPNYTSLPPGPVPSNWPCTVTATATNSSGPSTPPDPSQEPTPAPAPSH